MSGPAEIRVRRILLAWVGFVLVFFSLSGSKLPSYILPMFPASALLFTVQLRKVDAAVLRWHLLLPTLTWVVVALASTQTHRLVPAGTAPEEWGALASAVRVGALIFLVGGAIAWWCAGRRRITAAVVSVAFAHFVALTLVMQAHDGFGQLKSAAALTRTLLPLIEKDTPVFAVRSYDQTLPFYLRRNVVLVDYIDEFDYGQRHEPGKSLATLEEFMGRWQSLSQGAAYMTRETWRELRDRDVPMRVVFEDSRRLVVTKR